MIEDENKVSILQYFEMQRELMLVIRAADQKAIDIARDADQRAQDATLAAMNLRLVAMNEFRKTVEDVISKSVSRTEALGFLAGVIGLVLAVISLLVRM